MNKIIYTSIFLISLLLITNANCFDKETNTVSKGSSETEKHQNKFEKDKQYNKSINH